MIPRNVRVAEAPSHGKPVLIYDQRCAGSQAYMRARRRDAAAPAPRERRERRHERDGAQSGRRSGAACRHCSARPRAARPAEPRGAAPGADRGDPPVAVPAAAALCRGRARRPRPIDPREGHPPAAAGAAGRDGIVAEERGRISSWSPASGAGGRRSASGCTRCRSSSGRSAIPRCSKIALVENLQREDLSPLEEAEAYSRLMRGVRPHPGRASPRRSARAAAMSPTRCGCWPCRQPVRRQSRRGRAVGRACARAARRSATRRRSPPKSCAAASMSAPPRSWCGAGPPCRRAERRPRDADTRGAGTRARRASGSRVTLAQRRRGGALTLHYASLDQLDRVLSAAARRLSPFGARLADSRLRALPAGLLRDPQHRLAADRLGRQARRLHVELGLGDAVELRPAAAPRSTARAGGGSCPPA